MKGADMSQLMKWIDGLSVVMLVVSTLLLYAASRPVPGAITFVGGGKTEQEIKTAGRRRERQSRVGLAFLVIGFLVQFLRVVGVLR
jgi:hypothetical protein